MKSFPLNQTRITAVALAVLGAIALCPAQGQDWADEGNVYDDSSSRGLFKGRSGGSSQSAFNYNYLDLGYFNYEFDDDNVSSTGGLGAEFSLPIISTLYLTGGFGYVTPDTTIGDDLDFLSWNAGVGLGIPIKSNLDFVIEGGLSREKFVSDVLDDPIDGYGIYVTPGLRLMIGDLLELSGGVTITNIDSTTDLGVDLKALFHLTPSLSVFGSAGYTEEVSQYGLGLRLSF